MAPPSPACLFLRPQVHEPPLVGGSDRQMGRRGSSFPAEVRAPAVVRKGRLGMEGSNQIQSSLVCLATTTSTVEAVATTRASMQALDREALTTSRVPPATASATTARPSPTSTATPMEHVGGRTTLDALGVTQLDGETLAVETSSLPAGSQTTPGLTELAPQVVDLEMSIRLRRR